MDTKRIADPDAKKPEDWDEDEPYEILDEDAVKPEGWLDDELLTIPDPGSHFSCADYLYILIRLTQMLISPKNGMTKRMASGSHLLFLTPSVKRLLAAVNGNGN